MSASTPNTIHGSYLMPSLENATVGDAMHPGVMTCEPDATVTDVARMMSTHHVHCMAMMGVAHAGGESLGWAIISDLDLIRAGVEATDRLAAEMASGPAVSVEPTTPLTEAARLMLANRSPHLLVIDPRKQRPVGILSTLDIAGVLAWGEA
jgi:CBS domain-containing protein